MLADEDLTKGAESTLRLVGETIATIHQFYSRAFFSWEPDKRCSNYSPMQSLLAGAASASKAACVLSLEVCLGLCLGRRL